LRRTITQPEVLQRICLFLADNIGNSCSANKIQGALNAFGYSTGAHTVAAYIQALTDAYIFYPTKRYDIRGKEHLKTLGKYYISDVGLRNYLLGYRDIDQGRVLKNLVFLQLLYEGYQVSVGKLYNKEIDFIAVKNQKRLYIQVTQAMYDKEAKARETAPLLSIKDGYEKIIIVGEGSYPTDIEGIRILNASECLMGSISL
jgi:predicted AAA+ superfamily ATPase